MKQKIKNIFRIIGLIISIILFVGSAIILYMYYNTISADESVVDDLKNTIIISSDGKKDYRSLWELNHDFVGWLKINGTNIDYPVMQTPENEQFYLNHNFYKEPNYEGTLFCNANSDVTRPSDNIIIYGHHMKTNTMFHCLDQYENKEFYEEHKYINFDTLTEYGTYEVIAAFRTDVNKGHYEYWHFVEGTKEDFEEYVNYAVSRTAYTPDSTAEYGDKLISLSTCAYHTTNGRFVVVAKRISSEKAINETNESDENNENNE